MTAKFTISLPDEQLESIKDAVAEGRADSVSGYLSALVSQATEIEDLSDFLDDLDRRYGEPDEEARAWAAQALRQA